MAERIHIHEQHADTMGTQVYSSSDNKSMHKSLNREFLLYQRLLQRLSSGKHTFTEDEMTLLRYFNPEENLDHDTMEEFDTSYEKSKAIYWYTRETCIYKMLNKALRTQNIDDLVPFGPLIKDLNEQLASEHKLFVEAQSTPEIFVYRGQFLSKDELTRLKCSEGKLVSMNSFLSTSTDKDKAVEFATSRPPPIDTLVSVLLEITVSMTAQTRPFADIKHLSAFAEEAEILFMFGCVFRIDKVSFNDEAKIWMINLSLCSEGDEDLKEFKSNMQQETEGCNDLLLFGDDFIETHQYVRAEEYFRKLLQDKSIKNPIEKASCYQGIGRALAKQGKDTEAIEMLNQAISYLPPNNPRLVECYNELGIVHTNAANYPLAFENFDKALRMKPSCLFATYFALSDLHCQMTSYSLAIDYLQRCLSYPVKLSHPNVTKIYIEMAKIFIAMHEQGKALELLDKVVAFQTEYLSSEHPDLGYTYSTLALMYAEMEDQSKAISLLEKALEIQSKSLPKNHPDFAETYRSLADCYAKQGELDRALACHESLLENQLKTLAPNHPSVVKTNLKIGHVHWQKKQHSQGSVAFLKVLESELEKKKFGDPLLTPTFKLLADLYLDQYHHEQNKDILDKALLFYEKCLLNELETKTQLDDSLIQIYELLASSHYYRRHLDQSLVYHNRILDCYFQKRPVEQEKIDQVYTSIARIYLKKHHLHHSLTFFAKKSANQTKELSETEQFRRLDDIHFERRHFDQALNYFQNSIKNNPSDKALLAQAYFITGNLHLEQNGLKLAIKSFEASLQIYRHLRPIDYTLIYKIQRAIDRILSRIYIPNRI